MNPTVDALQSIPTALWWVLAAWLVNGIFNARAVSFIFKQIVDYNAMKTEVAGLKTKVTKLESDVTAAHSKIRDFGRAENLRACGNGKTSN